MERAEAEAILDGEREAAVALLMQIGELVEANRRLEARVCELEQRLNRSSRNSSLPPSQDPPSAPPRPQKAASGRRPGGQPGHQGRSRPLLPLERVDQVVEHWPERCRTCAHVFGEDERIEAAPVHRHQVFELPPIAVRVSEHRLHRLACPDCGRETRAQLPAEVPGGAFGPRLQAAVATLAVRNRVSRRDTVELARDLFGAELSIGAVDATVQRAGEALALPYEELLRHVRCAPAVNVDETGWRTAGGKRTLWAALTPTTALFRIAPDRHRRQAQALLGEHFQGIACTDRWWAYDYLEPERRQVCWSHLVRDFTAHSEGLAVQKQFGEHGLTIAGRVFEAWDEYRREGDRAQLLERIEPLEHELRTLLEHAARRSTKTKYHPVSSPATCSSTGRRCGPSPPSRASSRPTTTPNAACAERSSTASSRSAASPSGERTIERLLSASVTCRLQRRSLFAYLADVLSASILGDPIPALA